ncbi:MAG: polysaccharide deacetylase family protein [Acetobacteraceae bacterium]
MKLRSHDRYDFDPLPARAAGRWPGGARLAFYVALNLEQYAFGEGLVEDLVTPLGQPDVMNYSWRDWGNRVGAWRLLAMFRELGIAPSLLVNTVLYDSAPGLIEAFRALGCAVVSHGRTNAEAQAGLDEPAETTLIHAARDAIARHEGRPPRGWLGPWISETERTPDLLAEAGFGYVLDWAMDDQPVWLRTRGGRILSVPYPQELNDANSVVLRRDTGREFGDMIRDACDEMLEHGGEQPLVMGVALHAHVSGQPFRLRPLRQALRHVQAQGAAVWITDTDRIATEWERAHPPLPRSG